MTNWVVVEFHAFYDSNDDFVVKELAIVGDNFRTHLVFKPPYDSSHLSTKANKSREWVTRNLHRIKWDEGGVPYDTELIRTLCSPFAVLHTNGVEKARFLRQFHDDVRDYSWLRIEENELTGQCPLPQHVNGAVTCAMHNALKGYKSLTTLKVCPFCNHVA